MCEDSCQRFPSIAVISQLDGLKCFCIFVFVYLHDFVFVCSVCIFRSWHQACLSAEESKHADSVEIYVCVECRTKSPVCFVCRQKTSQLVLECKYTDCGKYFHESCLSQFSSSSYKPKVSKSGNVLMACPRHHCGSCGLKKTVKPLMTCLRCPEAYHKEKRCIPPGIFIYSTDSSSKFLCQSHVPHPTTGRDPNEDPGIDKYVCFRRQHVYMYVFICVCINSQAHL